MISRGSLKGSGLSRCHWHMLFTTSFDANWSRAQRFCRAQWCCRSYRGRRGGGRIWRDIVFRGLDVRSSKGLGRLDMRSSSFLSFRQMRLNSFLSFGEMRLDSFLSGGEMRSGVCFGRIDVRLSSSYACGYRRPNLISCGRGHGQRICSRRARGCGGRQCCYRICSPGGSSKRLA